MDGERRMKRRGKKLRRIFHLFIYIGKQESFTSPPFSGVPNRFCCKIHSALIIYLQPRQKKSEFEEEEKY
jgi:hypothetical protein